MTEPNSAASTPPADEHGADSPQDLIEPEGVDAGSSGPEDMRPGGDARAGGAAGSAPAGEPAAQERELAGVPDQGDTAVPGQELSAGEG